MKVQIFMTAVSFTAMVFVSCSKERTATQENEHTAQAALAQKPGNPGPSVKGGLLARYEFNSNLKEFTGILGDAVPTTAGAAIYTTDRNGVPENAIKFNGRYGVAVLGLPAAGSEMSVAAWVKYDSTNLLTRYILNCFSAHPEFSQELTSYYGVISTPVTTSASSGPVNDKWHHLVATYDGTTLKFYVDGVYVGNTNNPTGWSYPPGFTTDYQVGYMTPQNSKDFLSVWYGSLDDLRFYGKVLSAKEVTALFNL